VHLNASLRVRYDLAAAALSFTDDRVALPHT
jgi:hypothetical protein